MTYPIQTFADIPTTTICPDPVEDTQNFIQYINRIYEEIAFAINARVIPYYTINISTTAMNIPNLATFGSFFVAVSGIYSSQPTGCWALVKSTSTSAGSVNTLRTQAGSGEWSGINLTITSTATNFQIAHNLSNVTDTFNISVFGTQLGNQ